MTLEEQLAWAQASTRARGLPERDAEALAAVTQTLRILAEEARSARRMRPAALASLRAFLQEAAFSEELIELLTPAAQPAPVPAAHRVMA